MQHRRFIEIPATREGFPGNVPPLCQADIRQFSQLHGELETERLRFVIQSCIQQGGFNPNAIDIIFPDGRDKRPDDDELKRVIGNFLTWQEYEP